MANIKCLMQSIGYQFNNLKLIRLALTHSSAGDNNNERLEFLGDSIVNFIIAELLYKNYLHANEGKLTRKRALLVRKETLAKIGKKFNLSSYLTLGPSEKISGENKNNSIVADAVESLIAAIYLDSDLQTCSSCVHKWFKKEISTLSSDEFAIKDAKSLLQEWLQAEGKELPKYIVLNEEGPAHSRIFTIHCDIGELSANIHPGISSSKKDAEQCAARNVLDALNLYKREE